MEKDEKTYEMLLKDIEEYKKSGKEMGEEILALKRSIASYKSANTTQRMNVKKLNELYEKQTIEVFTLKATLSNKEKDIESLQSRVDLLNTINTELNEKIVELNDKLCVAAENYDYVMSLPWYKRLFFKK